MVNFEPSHREAEEGISGSFEVAVKAVKEASSGRQKMSETSSNLLDSRSRETRVSFSLDFVFRENNKAERYVKKGKKV